MNKSTVSVVIPCYNLGEYLAEAVASAQAQRYPPIEVIIVDDGSNDAQTIALLPSFEGQAGVTVCYKANGGASSARNYGIQRAQGDYILCLDADDVLDPAFLAETVAQLDAQSVVGVVSTYVESFGHQETIWRPQEYAPHKLLWENQICGGSLFRKICWEQAGGYKPIRGWEDWELWVTIIEEHGWQWAVVPKPLYRYRRRPGSLSDVHGQQRTEILRQMLDLHAGLYQQHFGEIFMEMDGKLRQVREQLQKFQRDNKTQVATIQNLKQSLQAAQQQVKSLQNAAIPHAPTAQLGAANALNVLPTPVQLAAPLKQAEPVQPVAPVAPIILPPAQPVAPAAPTPVSLTAPATQVTPKPAQPVAPKPVPKSPQPNPEAERKALVQRVQTAVPRKLPAYATVLVVTQGDARFLNLAGRTTQPFPQHADGSAADELSTNDADLMQQLEARRNTGAEFLLVPQSGLTWLAQMASFERDLERTYRCVLQLPDTGRLYDLRTPMAPHTFSVVIATYNRADKLGKAIESVFQQNYPKDKYELIIVDNNSTDQTAAVVESYRAQSPVPLAYYVEKRTGLSYTRNLGIEKAQLEFVAQLDDDAIAVPDWLAAMNEVINQHHALVVGGRVEKYFYEGYTPPAWFNNRYLLHYFGVNYRDLGKKERIFRVRHPLYLPGGNTAYARRLFDHFGGFRADLGRSGKALLAGEESFLNLILDRNDIPMYYSDDVCIYHHVGADRLNQAHMRKRAYWSGVTSAYMNPLFFGYADTYAKTSGQWRELRRLFSKIVEQRGSVDNFSRICQLLYLVGYLFKFYREFAKYKLRGQPYTPPQATWTIQHWIEEVSRWPESEEKYEQLYQFYQAAQDPDQAQQARAKLEAILPPDGSKSIVDQWEQLRGPLRRLQYEWLIERFQSTVEQHTAPGGRVAVISKGDEQLVQFNSRQGCHFPQSEDGQYAGYYPADSAAAIAHLATLQAQGVTHLVLPSTALWWLDHYGEFKAHLLQQGQIVAEQPDTCLIFALHQPAQQPSLGATNPSLTLPYKGREHLTMPQSLPLTAYLYP